MGGDAGLWEPRRVAKYRLTQLFITHCTLGGMAQLLEEALQFNRYSIIASLSDLSTPVNLARDEAEKLRTLYACWYLHFLRR
jgi:hypothetical protein